MIKMRISDIISLGSQYLVLGIIFSVIITAAILIIYRFFLKKRSVPIKKVLPWAVFACYIIVVLGATLMMRESLWEGRKIMPLFYSYREAWVDFSAVMWRNIILNILMLVPFGFLLPLCHRIFDNIDVGECKIGYVIDSKGFYQPVYNFSCTINNQPTTIAIAAIQ